MHTRISGFLCLLHPNVWDDARLAARQMSQNRYVMSDHVRRLASGLLPVYIDAQSSSHTDDSRSTAGASVRGDVHCLQQLAVFVRHVWNSAGVSVDTASLPRTMSFANLIVHRQHWTRFAGTLKRQRSKRKQHITLTFGALQVYRTARNVTKRGVRKHPTVLKALSSAYTASILPSRILEGVDLK
ncbi:hypothetical protein BDW22DRAFT_465969 [Trametopsis cervina]|nr:hypothetical protein BDW22DRAFT_465969 [Trametopsis cervina]